VRGEGFPLAGLHFVACHVTHALYLRRQVLTGSPQPRSKRTNAQTQKTTTKCPGRCVARPGLGLPDDEEENLPAAARVSRSIADKALSTAATPVAAGTVAYPYLPLLTVS